MKTTKPQQHNTALAVGLLAAMGLTYNCSAQLDHYYNFATGTANDLVGTANGTVHGTATLSGGALNTDGSLGTWSGSGSVNGVSLPASAVAGINGAFTIQCWYYANYNGGYCTSFSFSDGTENNYIIATPARGNFPYASSIAVIGGGGSWTGPGDIQASGQYQDTSVLHDMVVTFDGTTLTYYQDGSLANYPGQTGTSVFPTITDPGLNLSSLTDIGIAGGSPWPDNSIKGQTYSFAIYGQALSASQVGSLYALGDDASAGQLTSVVPEPLPLTMTAIGSAAILALWPRRKTTKIQATPS